MKAKDYNGTIKIGLPKSYGKVIGGFDKLSDSELAGYGFYNVNTPSYNSNTQELGDIYFDSSANEFTYPVNNKTWTETLAELKERKINNLKSIYNNKLAETDWKVTKELELGNTIPQSLKDDRAALRTECNNKESEINALTTKSAVESYTLPELSI